MALPAQWTIPSARRLSNDVVDSENASLCQIPTVLQAKHSENISEKRQSDAVKFSTNVQVAVSECLSKKSLVFVVIISEKSITENTFFGIFMLLILLESRDVVSV